MKKKFITFVISFVMIFSSLAFFVGCDNKDGDDPNAIPQQILLYDFEKWGPDFQLCRISEGFGRISENTDLDYVKTGTKSCRIDPLGYLMNKKVPSMYFQTLSDLFDYDYSDFLNVNSVRIEIYNAQSENKTVEVGLVSKVTSVTEFDRVNKEEIVLKPGWNTVDLYVNGPIVSATADIRSIQGVYITFTERANSPSVTDTTPRYYIDNIKLIMKSTPNETEFNLDIAKNEFMDFEKFYQEYFLINEFGVTLEVVKAADYGINATSGSKVMRLVMPGSNTLSWNYYVKIPVSYLQKTVLGSLTQETAKNAYFCYESYNNYKGTINVCALFFLNNSTKYHVQNGEAEAGRWTQHAIKLTEIEAGVSGWIDDPGMFVFSIRDVGTEDREFFFDNFRIEFR